MYRKIFIMLLIAGLVAFSGCLFKGEETFTEPSGEELTPQGLIDEEEEMPEEDIEKPELVTESAPELEEPEGLEPVPGKDIEVTPLPEEPEDTSGTEASSPEVLLAKCLTEKGTKLYTASWCGHCKNQKEAFGDGLQYLDNTECAAMDGWSQVCTDAGVKAVPTWIFGDGTIQSGNTPLATLAEITGCPYTS